MSATVVVLASIAALILIIASFSFFLWKRRVIHRNTILEADFSRSHEEDIPEGRLSKILMRGAPVLRDVVEALRLASEDRNVTLLVAKVGGTRMKMAKAQEIRDAVTRFRSKGKRAVAYAESFGEFGQGLSLEKTYLEEVARGRRFETGFFGRAAGGP